MANNDRTKRGWSCWTMAQLCIRAVGRRGVASQPDIYIDFTKQLQLSIQYKCVISILAFMVLTSCSSTRSDLIGVDDSPVIVTDSRETISDYPPTQKVRQFFEVLSGTETEYADSDIFLINSDTAYLFKRRLRGQHDTVLDWIRSNHGKRLLGNENGLRIIVSNPVRWYRIRDGKNPRGNDGMFKDECSIFASIAGSGDVTVVQFDLVLIGDRWLIDPEMIDVIGEESETSWLLINLITPDSVER